MLTWEAESGWILDRKGNAVNNNGSRDYGLCQQNSQYHSSFIFRYSQKEMSAANLKLALLKDKIAHTKDPKKKTELSKELERLRPLVRNINSEFGKDFLDPYKQLDRCIGIWNDAKMKGRLKTTFYAFNVINVRPGVRDRFTY